MSLLSAMFYLCLWCQIVPFTATPSPGKKARSGLLRLTVHVGSAGLGALAFVAVSAGPLRRAVVAASVLALAQYWTFVRMERAFERQYGREPRLALWNPNAAFDWQDRRISRIISLFSLASTLSVLGLGLHRSA